MSAEDLDTYLPTGVSSGLPNEVLALYDRVQEGAQQMVNRTADEAAPVLTAYTASLEKFTAAATVICTSPQ